MKMLARLRYLFEEGFEVGNLSAYDRTQEDEGKGRASLTFVNVDIDGTRRLVTEEFLVTEEEARLCSQLFLDQQSN
ncbi:hypothetical protein TSACC_21299 [Terrimicrobium sacchariphilum]|jgi:hypothetical protein|uniref:Uncharacterized protein n=1 Tax=Terrimicrobium sacchariphilum TaxID=690879 RepID=A0A146G7P7_TERSA|nr:hypothetical protein [Terrimicrobium sacchariphilum]GAT32897.1 hypothetical protein TSACC_21299 [Terrimicrobium sacchariphilum]